MNLKWINPEIICVLAVGVFFGMTILYIMTIFSTQEVPEMGLFIKDEIVVFSDSHKNVGENYFWKDKDEKLITFAYVLSEDSNGVVSVYNPLTKENKQIHRQFLRLKEDSK